MLKIINVQNVYVNNKKVTMFDVYQLIDNIWIFDYNSSIRGWYKRNKTIAIKHCIENEVLIDLKDWSFNMNIKRIQRIKQRALYETKDLLSSTLFSTYNHSYTICDMIKDWTGLIVIDV